MKLKVLIIGGGPAGLAAAIQGAKLGLEITLLERGLIGENIRCAEGFIDSLKRLGKPKAGVRFRVEEVLVQAKGCHKLDATKIALWMIDRKEWQLGLKEEALSYGAKIIEKSPVSTKDLVYLKQQYDYIIDATGAPSLTSRLYNFREFYYRNSALTTQAVLQGDFSFLQGKIKVVIEPHYLGYYWIFPKGKDQAGVETGNVGIGWFEPYDTNKKSHSLRKELDRILVKESLSSYPVLRHIGGLCPVRMAERLVYDNILLVGDASGFTSPLHGGGIDLALISGQEAIKSIAERKVSGFKERIQDIIGPKLEVEIRLYQLWRNFSFDEVDDLICLLTGGFKHLSLKKVIQYPLQLAGEMSTIIRFWNGLSGGEWRKSSLLI